MSRILRLVLTGLASTALACGSSSPTNGSTTQAIDGEPCDGKGDPTNCKPAPQPGQPPPETGPCFQAELNGSLCLSSDVWRQIASAACGAQGAAVSSSTAGASCGGPTPKQPTDPNGQGRPDGNTGGDPGYKTPPDGTGPVSSSTGIKFTCCVGTKPPTPPPSPCIEIPFDATTNTDTKESASLVCRAKGLQLSSIVSSTDNQKPGASERSIAVCCAPDQPPPPNACVTTYVGDKQTCSTKEAIASQANAVCAQQGLSVGAVDITPCTASGQNGTEGALIAKVECCKVLAQPQDDQKP